jgi:hypothetical protein
MYGTKIGSGLDRLRTGQRHGKVDTQNGRPTDQISARLQGDLSKAPWRCNINYFTTIFTLAATVYRRSRGVVTPVLHRLLSSQFDPRPFLLLLNVVT